MMPIEKTQPKSRPRSRGSLYRGHLVAVILGAAVLAGITLGVWGLAVMRSARLTNTGSRLGVEAVVRAPATIRNNLFEVTVNGLKVSENGDQAFKPHEGNIFLAVTVLVKNKSTKTMQFFPSIQTYIRDVQGSSYEMHPMLLDNPLPAGDIASGSFLNGQLSYEVNKTIKHPKLYIDAGWFGSAPQVFDLGEIPISK